MRRRYEVEMTVPLGVRRGVMLFEEQNGIVRGTIDILGNKTVFHGYMDEEHFTVTGELKTSMRSIDYTGHGKIVGNAIRIQLRHGYETYEMTGIEQKDRCNELEGCRENEKVL